MASVRHRFQKMEQLAFFFERVLRIIIEHVLEAFGLSDTAQQLALQI